MNTPLSWIKDYVPELECSDKEYYDEMTLSGTKVEFWNRLDKNCERIVIARVEELTHHPDADHLWVTRLNIGKAYAANGYTPENDGVEGKGGTCIQICTSAQNLYEGAIVPVCLAGGKVAGGHDGGPLPEDGFKIKSGKMRGLASVGMMCGITEVASDEMYYPGSTNDGIFIFGKNGATAYDTDVTGTDENGDAYVLTVNVRETANAQGGTHKSFVLGDDALEALGLRDTNMEYEITSNRVDCYSILGIAREAAATFGKPFVPPVVEVAHAGDKDTSDYVSVEIQDKDLCTRYVAAIVTDIKIGPSPEWMQRRLANFGIRPINNLVDITNYVMMEQGQPMHAYDYDTIHGGKIIVKRAQDGETFKTLDDQDRHLDSDVLMICDADRYVGIAGIMGGEDSMITENVKTVLLEAATFNGTNIRKASKRIGMRTDASAIFEKGLDPYNALTAMDRACQLFEELGCGTVAKTYVDVHDELPALTRIAFEPDKINAYLGTSYTKERMLEVFDSLELVYDEAAGEIVVPSFRQDVKRMCDLAEDVARIDGYDKVPSTLPQSSATMGRLAPMMILENAAREIAQDYGYSESMTFSFESPKVFDALRLPADSTLRNAIKIKNPLGDDYSLMRTSGLNGILTSLGTNYARRNKDVKLFEFAKVYLPKALPLEDYPDERPQLVLGFYGKGDFYTLKGAVEDFLTFVGIKGRSEYAVSSHPFLHPGRQAEMSYKGHALGFLGEVHPDVTKVYGIGDRAYVAQIDLPTVLELASFAHHYEGIAKFPAMTRDLSMLVPKTVAAGEIEDVIEQRGGKLLESFHLFDIYEGAQVKEGCKSMAYSMTFRHKDRTLETEEVDKTMKKILNGLERLGIELRA